MCYNCSMTTDQGAVTPYQGGEVSGMVLPPLPSPDSRNIHEFSQLMHTIVGMLTFKDEKDVHRAHSVIEALRATLMDSRDHARTIKGTDRAPVEDVSKRIAPSASVPAYAGPVIDYQQLAEAILRAQQVHTQAQAQQQAPPQQPAQVHDITSMPPAVE